MFEDDEGFGEGFGFSGYRRPRTSRVFTEARDDQPSNVQAWKAGIASIKAGDAEGMLRFLQKAKGSARLLNTRGGEARGPVAKAILALRDDAAAWRRLNDPNRRFNRSAPGEDSEPEIPYGVWPIQVLWAAAPDGLARVARLWRQESLAEGKWWSSPFIYSGYEGPPEICRRLSSAANRRLDSENYRQDAFDEAEPLEDNYSDHSEKVAMAAILIETARACIDQLWAYEERAGALRLASERVWSRGGGEWGLRWHGAIFNVELSPGAPPKTVTMAAAMDSFREALAAGPSEAALACRKIVIGSNGSGIGGDIQVAALAAWIKAFPDDACGLPFAAGDWLPAKLLLSLCDRAEVSNEALGRWLARDGRQWSTPACLARSGELKEAAPLWAGGPASQNGVALEGSWAPWTPLEWAILERPEAALLACKEGAVIDSGVEALLLSQANGSGRNSAGFSQAHAVAEACRISELCAGSGSDSSPSRSPFKAAL